MCHQKRFELSLSRLLGFTRARRYRVPFVLGLLSLVAAEIHDLIAFRFRSGLRSPFPVPPICLLRLSAWSASLALPTSGLLCPLLTSDLLVRSPEVSSAAFHAQSPNLRFAFLMDMDFAVGVT